MLKPSEKRTKFVVAYAKQARDLNFKRSDRLGYLASAERRKIPRTKKEMVEQAGMIQRIINGRIRRDILNSRQLGDYKPHKVEGGVIRWSKNGQWIGTNPKLIKEIEEKPTEWKKALKNASRALIGTGSPYGKDDHLLFDILLRSKSIADFVGKIKAWGKLENELQKRRMDESVVEDQAFISHFEEFGRILKTTYK